MACLQTLDCTNSATLLTVDPIYPQCVITDPPYVGNVNYSSWRTSFYVWLRLVLKDRYLWFAPEHTPKAEEIVENRTRVKSEADFYAGLI